MDRATWVEGSFDYRKAAAEYPKAFAGLAVLKDDAAAVAARLGSSPIKDQLVAALDDWAWSLAFSVRNEIRWSDSWRWHGRRPPIRPGEIGCGSSRSGATRKPLASSWPKRRPPDCRPSSLTSLGHCFATMTNPQGILAAQAQAEHPADFWLNFNLARVLEKTNPAEAAGFYRVALAVRPQSGAAYNNLGVALSDQGKLSEAIAAFRKAIELDPKHAYAYSNLGLRPGRPGEGGRGHRRLPQGHRNQPQECRCPQQPRRRPGRAEQAGRGHRRLP